jgi:hypothetical protein
VPIAVVASRIEAELIVGLLRNNGLTAAVSADDAGGQEPQLQIQGVRVLVPPSEEASARRLLADADDTSSEADLQVVRAPAGTSGRTGHSSSRVR